MDVENRLPVGTMVILNSSKFSRGGSVWKKWGNKSRKIIDNNHKDICGRTYLIEGLDKYCFKREWLIVVDKEFTCKFMKKKV